MSAANLSWRSQRAPWRLSRAGRESLAFYAFLTPWLVGFVVLTAGPIIATLVLSFTSYNIVAPPRFVGLTNYSVLVHTHLFWQALKVTLVYTLGSVPLTVIGALVVASLLNQRLPGLSVWRTIYYLPVVTAGVAVALLWSWVFLPDYGLANSLLWTLFHIHGPQWFFSETWVLPAFIMMSVWGVGGPMLIYLAGMQGIPTQLYEAAELDGANALQRYRHVTLPMITPVIFFNLITSMIGTFQIFVGAYVITQGGPNYASYFYVLYLYQEAFQYFHMGYATALAWVLFLVIFVMTVLAFWSSRHWVYYEGFRSRP
ncbi:MAG: sugar ABC transporter permease [Chloroflexi bacterium]|nr:sugar ABC transporter permease [Chloroflexota bacterium]